MTATTSTKIQGVSVLSRQKGRPEDVFELVLSRQGIEVHRPERPVRQMSWDRISEWEIEERNGYVLLILRGQGATTPLVVPDWTLDDLEILMRDVTSGDGGHAHQPDVPEPAAADETRGAASAAVAVVPAPAAAQGVPAPAVPARVEQRKLAARGAWMRLSWRVVVTVALLGILATAVILVLLQSAGIIDWSFLGPVA